MLLARHSALVKFFELSSWPAALVGPNALKPAALRSSTIPAAIGASGPTTTKSTLLVLQKSITAAWSAISNATHSASRAMPALPGAHQSFVSSGEAAIFHARACSRPPEPSRRMFMRRRQIRDFEAKVGRTSLPPFARGEQNAVIPDGAPARRSGIPRLFGTGVFQIEIPGSLALRAPSDVQLHIGE